MSLSRRTLLLGMSAVAVGTGAAVARPVVPASASATSPGLPPALWSAWRARVIDDMNGSISHSEGQGYGMVLAASAGDRRTFDALWAWTRENLTVRGDGLAAWRWDPRAEPPVSDRNNATDGDILIAWGLGLAARRWNDKAYRRAGGIVARALFRHAVVQTNEGPLLLPGAAGFRAEDRDDGPVVNLSYWVFPAFPVLAKLAPEYDWDGLARTGLMLLRQARFGARDLPADWTALGGNEPRPAKGFPPSFGWNAVRVPLYLAWAEPGTVTRGHMAPFARLWGGAEAARPATVNLLADKKGQAFGSSGYEAIPALVACAMSGAPFPKALLQPADEPYYPATLRLLSVLAAATRFPSCL